MSKKKISLIALSIVAVIALTGGISYAIWADVTNTKGNAGISSGDWNESAKYIEYEKINNSEGQQIAWRVSGYTGLVDKLAVPSKVDNLPVTEIGGGLSNNSLVKEIILPGTITLISDNAFVAFTKLTKLTVTNGANFAIGANSFSSCKVLSVFDYQGCTITNIGQDAFLGCPNLATKPTT